MEGSWGSFGHVELRIVVPTIIGVAERRNEYMLSNIPIRIAAMVGIQNYGFLLSKEIIWSRDN